MKAALYLTIILSAACLSWAITSEYKELARAAMETCANNKNVDFEHVHEIVVSDKLPKSDDEKGIAACYLKEIGFIIVEYSFDWGKFKALNHKKYECADLVKKADKVADACSKVVNGTFSDLIELSHQSWKCYMTEAEKIHLPKPDL